MAQHTPAPWTLGNTSAATPGPVAIKSPHGLYVGTAATLPDARLMAAAPDLLEALEAALPTIKRPSHDHPTCHCAPCGVMRRVRAAITKAKSEAV